MFSNAQIRRAARTARKRKYPHLLIRRAKLRIYGKEFAQHCARVETGSHYLGAINPLCAKRHITERIEQWQAKRRHEAELQHAALQLTTGWNIGND